MELEIEIVNVIDVRERGCKEKLFMKIGVGEERLMN